MANFKTAHVKFEDESFNYKTSINPKMSDSSIKEYFEGKYFNLGTVVENLQQCKECIVTFD